MDLLQFHSYTREDIFDLCYPSFNLLSVETQGTTELFFNEALTSLLEDGLVNRSLDVNGDELITPTGKPMEDINDYVDMSKEAIASLQLQKSIMGCLTIRKSIFNSIILYCQYDKSNQQGLFIVNAIKTALTDGQYLPVIFVVGDNLSNLMDQTIEGFQKLLCKELDLATDKYEGLMCLKGDEKTRQQDIENYIDSYHLSYILDKQVKKLPPIIMALNNKTQLKKLIDIHQKKIVDELGEDSKFRLRSAFVFDEFDKVYRSLRPLFKPLLVDSPVGVFSVLGVTGSEDGICEEFPEWASSNLVVVEVNADKERDHRGIHHSEAVIHRYKQVGSVSNSSYALDIIKANLAVFKEARVNPRNGSTYYPKTIILADSRIASHKTLATQLLAMGFHVILQNENNLKVQLCISDSTCAVDDNKWKPWSIRKKVVRNELYKMFNELNMWNAPVALIGNRKLDRGLGYHYAPPTVNVAGTGTPASRGLIWTDEIMGHIDSSASRIQKVSRIHGVIAQCEDYPNQLNFWVDERTELTVRNENEIIKSLNDGYRGFHSLGERLDYARNVATLIKKTRNYLISDSFATRALAKAWFIAEKARLRMDPEYECSAFGLYHESATDDSTAIEEGTPGITKIRYRGVFETIMTEKELRKTDKDIGQGANTSARIMPVYVEDVIRFVVIYVVKINATPVNEIVDGSRINEYCGTRSCE